MLLRREDLDHSSSEKEDEEEANLYLVADVEPDDEPCLEDDNVFSYYPFDLEPAYDKLLTDTSTLFKKYEVLRNKSHKLQNRCNVLKEDKLKLI